MIGGYKPNSDRLHGLNVQSHTMRLSAKPSSLNIIRSMLRPRNLSHQLGTKRA